VPDLVGLLTTTVGVQDVAGFPLLGLRETPLMDPWSRFKKRALDLTAASVALLITLPLWGVIAWMIRRDSPGPIFYVQERVGQDGKHFQMLKFRTMRVGAETKTGPVWTQPGDDRRTRTGIFLRRWNLDELPQLLNVLAGDMSLVGPRPERPHFVRQFREDVPRYMTRHRIRSGMTGWAQIHGLRGDTSIDERTKYDLFYLENWSLWLDCVILYRSFGAVKNAY
ncbi:MAG: sugar transferase, partial [Candidatus Omnitrophica bacterium]|nr:sugar transferase [Candidatus Omnitrophota bacterium]